MSYVFITGASSGLGRELSVYMSGKKDLLITGRDQARLEETKSMCSGKHEIIAWPYDLSNVDSLESDLVPFLKYPVENFVHCAGAMSMLPLRSIASEKLNRIFSVNVFSAAVIMKVLASKKINGRNLKSAVMISSNISERGAKAFSVYGASKAALDGLVRNLAVELAPSVRVNAVCPGGMRSRMTEEMFADEELSRNAEGKYPSGFGKFMDIVPAVEFLLSDNARWLTGQSIVIDGGRTLNISDK